MGSTAPREATGYSSRLKSVRTGLHLQLIQGIPARLK